MSVTTEFWSPGAWWRIIIPGPHGSEVLEELKWDGIRIRGRVRWSCKVQRIQPSSIPGETQRQLEGKCGHFSGKKRLDPW
jgi:hypothetical protein